MSTSKDEEKNKLEVPPDLTHFQNQVMELSNVFERMNLKDYIHYLSNPKRMLLMNFAAGLLRGLGATIGATILASILFMLLKHAVLMNLPVIGGIIGEIVKIVNAHNGY